MEAKVILLDTSILIEYYRKKDKSKSVLYKLSERNVVFAVSAITHFEIFNGAKEVEKEFWDNFFAEFIILSFNKDVSHIAGRIDNELKKSRKQIAIPDLFIAATAISNKLPIATLNKKHFERIGELTLVSI